MLDPLRLPRRFATTAVAGAAFAAALAFAAPAFASPLPPAGAQAGPALAGTLGLDLLSPVQYWGPRPGWGPHPYGPPRYGWGGHPHGWGGPRCTIRYVRVWDDWRGGYVSRPVRRCW
jgi:hypothetical protein